LTCAKSGKLSKWKLDTLNLDIEHTCDLVYLTDSVLIGSTKPAESSQKFLLNKLVKKNTENLWEY